MPTINVPEVLAPVEDYLEETKLVAFDGCHKIYMALDDIEANWFRQEYPYIVQGNKDAMLQAVVDWYEQSCSLKFVNGVRHHAEDPNKGFIIIVEQGAEEAYEECDWCGSTGDTNGFGLCPECDDELSAQYDEDEEE